MHMPVYGMIQLGLSLIKPIALSMINNNVLLTLSASMAGLRNKQAPHRSSNVLKFARECTHHDDRVSVHKSVNVLHKRVRTKHFS